MNEYKKMAIKYAKTHLDCVGYRDYIVDELMKLEKIKQIINTKYEIEDEDTLEYRINAIKEVLE